MRVVSIPPSVRKIPSDNCGNLFRYFAMSDLCAEKKYLKSLHILAPHVRITLVMAGVDLRTVQELMGHKTIAMTLRYSHLSPTHQRKAVQRLTKEPAATTTATKQKVA